MMDKFFYELFLAYFGSLGFSLVFDNDAKYLPICALSGALTFCIEYISSLYFADIFVNIFICAAIAAFISEIFARVLRAPSTVFLLPSIIPLVPGSKFFYAVRYAITGDTQYSLKYLTQTVEYAFGIAAGILIISFVFSKKRDLHNRQIPKS